MLIDSLSVFRRENKRVYCYGIGKWGSDISYYCKKHKILIDGYIVSDNTNNEYKYRNKRVYRLSEMKLNEYDGIIIAIRSNKDLDEVVRNIKNNTLCRNVYIPFENNDFIKYFIRKREKRRKNISRKRRRYIFNYNLLKDPIRFESLYLDKNINWLDERNRCYGHDYIRKIKEKLNLLRCNLNTCTLLHSVSLRPNFTPIELRPVSGNLFCMSGYGINEEFHGGNIKHIIELGPYILRVKTLISSKVIGRIKKKNGKTLLVVPSHVYTGKENSSFSLKQFIGEIELIKKKFEIKTVYVCIGPRAHNIKEYRLYKEKGYKVVTAGDDKDVNFLRRLKTFIALSDMTMGNDWCSSFAGYSVSMNTPYYYYDMDIDYKNADKINQEANYFLYGDLIDIRTIFKELFGIARVKVTSAQILFVEKHWGKWIKVKSH